MAQQQQSAAIAAASPPSLTELAVTKPSRFNGSLTSYHGWWRSVSLYMKFIALRFPDDAIKVACVLACITLGLVSSWAQAYFEEHLDVASNFAVGT